jgi:hypothetical protein
MRWKRQALHMGDMRNLYEILVGSLKRKEAIWEIFGSFGGYY